MAVQYAWKHTLRKYDNSRSAVIATDLTERGRQTRSSTCHDGRHAKQTTDRQDYRPNVWKWKNICVYLCFQRGFSPKRVQYTVWSSDMPAPQHILLINPTSVIIQQQREIPNIIITGATRIQYRIKGDDL
ncbi:uncharacterized protein LOC119653484 [Hermetia illucens]|uniref:uncharacterized protein LOC119653484 n=1 Tax=Hermetia illucens TaxID=343691 RepID=UPI0018CC6D07|nr:uncharacterized protein LOC119653484 [Hermetia illucens]